MQKPFSLLIKPASADCNLRCTYCFYLDHADLYPETKVHRMSDETLEAMISSYMSTSQPIYSFGWQGGEPTLMGLDFFKKVVALQKKYARPGVKVSNGLQTNSTLIDDEFAAFLAENHFLVGISLDGPAEIHDYYRLDAAGNGTHHRVIKSINLLKKHHVDFNILTLVNKQNVTKAKEVYTYLKKDLGVNFHQYIPCVEYLPNGQLAPFAITGEEWGTFLCDIFDAWYPNDTRTISVRHFDSIINFMVDGIYTSCNAAGTCCQYFVVETNGDVYPCDFFVQKPLLVGNVHGVNWSALQQGDVYTGFGNQKTNWNPLCKTCEYLPYCSGDCLKHRLYNDNPPENLSHLCAGWKKYYAHTLDTFKEIAFSIIEERQQHGFPPRKVKGLYPDHSLGRNDTCYCGSGKKYKKCHG